MLQKLLLLTSIYLLAGADAHIFVYHRFGDARYPSTNTSLEELKREFTYLRQHHYKVIPLTQLMHALRTHQKIDPKWVVLTIDDGFRSFLKALPLFQKFHYPFTLFIATKPIEDRYKDFLRWSDLEAIIPFGQIALHSHAHAHLCDLNDTQIQEDTKKALALFQAHLHYTPSFYAYPYGEYNARVQKILTSFGFNALFTQDRGAIDEQSDPNNIPRIAMVGKSDIEDALRIKHLHAHWIEPKSYPKDGILRTIEVEIPSIYHYAWIYVSGYGWRRVQVNKGKVTLHPSYKLLKRRTRVIIKVKNSKIDTKLFVRSRYATQ